MANYRKNNKDNGFFKRVAAIGISAVLVLGTLFAVGWGSSGFKNWDTSTWFNSWGNGDTQIEAPDTDGSTDVGTDNGTDNGDMPDDTFGGFADGGTTVTPSKNGKMQVTARALSMDEYEEYGIDTQAESASVLTATITPESTANKAVDWSIAWENPSSTWAKGKTVTDYVKIEPAADGALMATVANLKAFGEPIIITVQSRVVSDVKTTVKVDYLTPVASAFDNTTNLTLDTKTLNDVNDFTLGTGTITPTSLTGTATTSVTDKVKSSFQYGSYLTKSIETTDINYSFISIQFEQGIGGNDSATTSSESSSSSSSDEDGGAEDGIDEGASRPSIGITLSNQIDLDLLDYCTSTSVSSTDFYSYFSEYLAEANGDVAVYTTTLSLTLSYSNGMTRTCTVVCTISYNSNNISVLPRAISTNQSSLIFG